MASVGLSEQPVAERIGAALRARAGEVNRKGWIAELADEIGVSERQVKNWFYGHHTPGGAALLDLFAHLGPDFANEILEPTGLAMVVRNGVKAPPDAPTALLVADIRDVLDKHAGEAA